VGIENIKEGILDLLYPKRCPVCDDIVPEKKRLCCPECERIFYEVKQPRCLKCGKHIKTSGKAFCYDCSRGMHFYEYGVSLYEYASVHDSVYSFKNGNRGEYARFYGEKITEKLGDKILAMKGDALVPIPLHPEKFRKRGYNQAELLAKEISVRLGIPIRNDILIRIKNTDAQKHQGDFGRQNNMKKAFHMVQNDVKLKTIILVDDVYTTGNTIDAAAKELREGGIDRVFFVTLAIGKGK